MIRLLAIATLLSIFSLSIGAQVDLKTITVPGHKLVQYTYIEDNLYVMFEPSIPRDDKALAKAFLEIGEKVFALKKSELPIEDIVSTPKGNGIRYKYKKKTLVFLPMKNEDGTTHTIMVSEK